MNNTPGLTILYHLFYEDSVEEVLNDLQSLLAFNATFLFNVCLETPGKRSIISRLRGQFPRSYVICTSNKGKDIGAKLALIQLYLQLQAESDYFLFLHDKKSLQALQSSTWKKTLLKITEPEKIKMVLKTFSDDKRCGIIASKEYIIREPVVDGQFSGTNGKILSALLTDYTVEPRSFEFVAGTMFWARIKPVTDFFTQNGPLEIRKTLENGNVLDNFCGTNTHSWERLFSWLVTSRGYSIKGI